MRKTLLTTGAAVLALAAFPASAQVAGGLTGQVTGQVGGQVNAPVGSTLDSARDLTRDTVQDTRGLTRDTVRDGRRTLDHTPRAGADAALGAEAQAGVDASGASADLDVQTGAAVRGSDGGMLGHVADVTRDSAGRVRSVAVRAADGTVRTLPADGATVQGGAVVTTVTEAEFRSRPD